MPALDAEIDRLYQLPLDEFTAARNALATASGKDGAAVRKLAKPPLAAWAVNQVYWQHREVYASLVEAAEAMRAAHAAILSGKKADLRSTGRDHEAAIEAALKAALKVLSDADHSPSDATRQAIATTLRALPADEAPGRLTRTLQPGGFEMLAGIPVSSKASAARAATRSGGAPQVERSRAGVARGSQTTRAGKEVPGGRPTLSARVVAQARDALASATRALRAAEHAARREEFEAARAARDAERAVRNLGTAREALETAQKIVDEAEREAAVAERARDAAAGRAARAEEALEAARQKAEAARRRLDGAT